MNSSHFLSHVSCYLKVPAGDDETYSVITSVPGATGELLFILHLPESRITDRHFVEQWRSKSWHSVSLLYTDGLLADSEKLNRREPQNDYVSETWGSVFNVFVIKVYWHYMFKELLQLASFFSSLTFTICTAPSPRSPLH